MESNIADENRRLRAWLSEAARETTSLRDENERLRAKADTANFQTEQAYGQLQIIRNSIWWRATRPARMALQHLSR